MDILNINKHKSICKIKDFMISSFLQVSVACHEKHFSKIESLSFMAALALIARSVQQHFQNTNLHFFPKIVFPGIFFVDKRNIFSLEFSEMYTFFHLHFTNQLFGFNNGCNLSIIGHIFINVQSIFNNVLLSNKLVLDCTNSICFQQSVLRFNSFMCIK